MGAITQDSEIDEKCATLSQKLDSLLQTLREETDNAKYAAEEEEMKQVKKFVDFTHSVIWVLMKSMA